MKLKNIKATSKRSKPELLEMADSEDSDDQDGGDDDERNKDRRSKDSVEFKLNFPGKRKRCKKFSKQDCDLLITLYDKYCTNLDNSTSFSSIKRRNDAWDKVLNEFNSKQRSGIERELSELKIKIKNLKALRIKMEPNDSNDTSIYDDSNQDLLSASTPMGKNIIPSQKTSQSQLPIKIVASTSSSNLSKQQQNNHRESLIIGNSEFYDEFEVEVSDYLLTASLLIFN
jgi:hypothetical protein